MDSASGGAGLPGGNAGGDFGATQGGIQDMSLARDTIATGRVPAPEAFVVEAMFSEHDLPIEGEPCSTLLCLRAASGVALSEEGAAAGWVQVGMSSTIDPETFVRPSLSIVAVVDVSGSMGWEYGGNGTPGGLSKSLLQEVARQLGEGDRFSIVTYGSSSRLHLSPTPGGNPETISSAIESLTEAGSTNMEAGMRLGYEVARDEIERAEQVRLMLFTDVQPNVGLTSSSEFERLAKEGSDGEVGLTVFAVGLGLNPDVLRGMSQIRGANAFSLTKPEDVPALMADSWPWMVSPIAYELDLRVSASEGFTVGQGYGFPESTLNEASLTVSTVFLSRRRGALLLRIDPPAETDLDELSVEVALDYQTAEGDEVSQAFVKDFPSLDGEPSFEQVGVHKTVALARLVSSMKAAAELYGAERDSAISVLQAAHVRFEEVADALEDPDLERERELSADLLTLMREGASQDSFYGGF